MRENKPEEYQPKYDFEFWIKQIMEQHSKGIRKVFEWQKVMGEKIKQTETEERGKILDRNLPGHETVRSLENLENEAEKAREVLQKRYDEKIRAAMEEFLKQRKVLEEEQRIDRRAAVISQKQLNQLVREIERKLGIKTDEQIQAELDVSEEKWRQGNLGK